MKFDNTSRSSSAKICCDASIDVIWHRLTNKIRTCITFGMPNALACLLKTDPNKRSVVDYEKVFDDYIAFSSGNRIEDSFDIPADVLNADYRVESSALEIIIELKQINHYTKGASADRYFEKLFEQRKVRSAIWSSPTQVKINRDSLNVTQWNHFYRKWRPNVAGHLDKAARQLKSTAAFLPPSDRHRVYGVIMVNTGDFNLPDRPDSPGKPPFISALPTIPRISPRL